MQNPTYPLCNPPLCVWKKETCQLNDPGREQLDHELRPACVVKAVVWHESSHVGPREDEEHGDRQAVESG